MAALQHRMNWFFCLFVFLKVAEVQGLDNGLALTPPSRLSLIIHDTIDQYYLLLSLSLSLSSGLAAVGEVCMQH